MKLKTTILFLLVGWLILINYSTSVQAQMIDPFRYFHVYSLKDINYTNSDFQGTTGAARNVQFTNFLLTGMDLNNQVLHVGGDIANYNGRYNGAIEALGNLTLANVFIDGDIISGRNVFSTSGGTVTGDIYASGIIHLTQSFNVEGNKWTGMPYSPLIDHNYVSGFFLDSSKDIGIMADTGNINNKWGALTLDAVSGINVFSLDAADLNSAHSVTINGPEDAVIYLNTTGVAASLNSTNWYYHGGITPGDVLLNYSQAHSLSLSGGNNVNILAPFAETDFSSGLVTGNLIVGNLQGHGQVNIGHFTNSSEVPEPATMLLLGTALSLIGSYAQIKRKSLKK